MATTTVDVSGNGKTTMAEVARRAGVSSKSVSRVINKEPHISPSLVAMVEAAIAELNYVPDSAARSLAGSRSFTVVVAFDNPSPNYIMKVVNGAYRACVAHGYHMRFDTIDSQRGHSSCLDQLDAIIKNSRIDGIVLTPPLVDNPLVLDHLELHGIRFVRIAPVAGKGRSPSISIDDAAAAADIAQYLWDLGHRNIGFVNGPRTHGAAGKRRDGFLKRLCALDPHIEVQQADGAFLFDGGMEAGGKLLSSKRPPTAIFAANDDMAAGVIAACAQRQLAVPDDVSVVGFDDSWIATSVWPHLTTIYQPIEEMAAAAIEILLHRGAAGRPPEELVLNYRFVERASAAPYPASG
ncbi:MAG: LacI family DNA-binding transcriptional regulator [Croceibacterium sp.]